MAKYLLLFWFEHGGICIWGKNEATKEKYGYAIESNELPLSKELINILDNLELSYARSLNWASPLEPAPWTKDERDMFRKEANEAYDRLIKELGPDFEIINDIESCIYEKD